jgi:hypothetical protein
VQGIPPELIPEFPIPLSGEKQSFTYSDFQCYLSSLSEAVIQATANLRYLVFLLAFVG